MFDFEELDGVTRQYMLLEFRTEQEGRAFPPYRPANLSPNGERAFVGIMEFALRGENEESLAEALSNPEYWVEEGRRHQRGRLVTYRLPAAKRARQFAITEFNTWYVRGLARKLLEERVDQCEVYRVEEAYVPRSECLALEGQTLMVPEVYRGHRARYHPVPNPGALQIPIGTNCHHSIRRIRR
jgi:hypothetical protein